MPDLPKRRGRETVVDCTNPANIIIAYDPDVLSPNDYARLVTELGDVVRSCGGAGLVRIDGQYVELLEDTDAQTLDR